MTAVTRADLRNITDRLDGIDQKLHTHDEQFESIDRRFDAIDPKFDAIHRKFEEVDRRFEQVDQRFDRLEVMIRESADEYRQHLNLVYNDLQRSIHIAEGHAALVANQRGQDDRLDAHDQRHTEHDLRLLRVEEHAGLPPHPAPAARRTKQKRR